MISATTWLKPGANETRLPTIGYGQTVGFLYEYDGL
jgi:hypothetical protein